MAPARTTPGERTMVKGAGVNGRASRPSCKSATPEAEGGAPAGAADVQEAQQRCQALPASGAVVSAEAPPSAP